MKARFLLLQTRNADDPMRRHEVESFARVLEIEADALGVFDLLATGLTAGDLKEVDCLLLGGSGDYSAADDGPWLERALDSLRLVHGSGKPTFASCWGFQALARALGGRVIRDPEHAEIGTHPVHVTDVGGTDPVFAPLAPTFLAQMGHQDVVVELPGNATLLASSDRVRNEAYRFDDAPIYCTQFHPELRGEDLLIRLRNYPEYVERIAGVALEEFARTVKDSTPAEGILTRFVDRFLP